MHQAKVRINDLARELEVKSKSILDALPLAGIFQKKTHSSSLDADEADKVRAYFQAKQISSGPAGTQRVGPTPAKDEIRTKIDLSYITRPGDVLRAITQRTKTPPLSVPQSGIPSASRPSVRPVRGQPIYRRIVPTKPSLPIRPAAPAKRMEPTAGTSPPRVIMPHADPRHVYTVSTYPRPVELETAATTSERKVVDQGTIDQAEQALKILRAQEKQKPRDRDSEY